MPPCSVDADLKVIFFGRFESSVFFVSLDPKWIIFFLLGRGSLPRGHVRRARNPPICVSAFFIFFPVCRGEEIWARQDCESVAIAELGSSRILDLFSGEQLPRIC